MTTWPDGRAECARILARARLEKTRRNAPEFRFEECGCRWKDTGRPCPLDEGNRMWVCTEHGVMMAPGREEVSNV